MKLTTPAGNEYEGTPEHVFASVKAAEPNAIPRLRQAVIMDYVHNVARAYKAMDQENVKRLLTEAMTAEIPAKEIFDPLKKIYSIIVKNKRDASGIEYISVRKGITGKEIKAYCEGNGPILERRDGATLELNNYKRELAEVESRIQQISIGEHEGTLADRVMKIDETVDSRGGVLGGNVSEGHLEKGPIGGIITHSPRYILDQRVCDLVNEIAHDSPIGAFEHTKTPCGCFWMEYHTRSSLADVHIGLLWIGDEDQDNPHPELDGLPTIEAAVKSMVSDSSLEKGNLFIFLQVAGMVSTYVIPVTMGKPVGLAEFKTAEREALAATYWFFMSFCMLMTSPKTHIVEEVSFERLNKHRVKKGKSVFSSYSRVKLSISGPVTRRTVNTAPGDTSPSTGGHEEAHHGGKRLHMVNHFWRTKRGKLEFVRPHWRGNPELGTVSRKRVTA